MGAPYPPAAPTVNAARDVKFACHGQLPPPQLRTKRPLGEDMSDKDPSLRRNAPHLQLHVPEPRFRPGDTPDFSDLKIPAAGEAPRPDTSAPAAEMHPLTTALVRVLGDDNNTVGAWDPKLDPDTLRKML